MRKLLGLTSGIGLVATLLGATAAVVFGPGSANDAPSPESREGVTGTGALIVPAPVSLEEHVASAEVIVRARITGFAAPVKVFTDGTVGLVDDPGLSARPGGIDFTDFEVHVEQYLKGEGAKTLSLRLTGDHRPDGRRMAEFPTPPLNQEVVLFLTRSPMGAGIWQSDGGWGIVFEEADLVRYSVRISEDADFEPVRYLAGKDFGAAVAATAAMAAALPPGPPRPRRLQEVIEGPSSP